MDERETRRDRHGQPGKGDVREQRDQDAQPEELAALLMGYLNQRMFRYDALAEHAGATEMRDLVARNRRELFGLGVLVSLLSYIPFAGLAVPVAAGLAFIHYCLNRLAALRSRG